MNPIEKEIQEKPAPEREGKGRTIKLYEPTPWPDAVTGHEVLTEATENILRHTAMKRADAYACVLWAAHTYIYKVFDHTPRLLISAPDAECGKTLLMTHMVGNMSNKVQTVELMGVAPFFRLSDEYGPTFLIDEADTFIGDDRDLQGGINNGWEPHGGVLRCVGDDNDVRKFSTYCPAAIAGIRLHEKLPNTTVSRSVVINLDRATPEEVNCISIYDAKIHRKALLITGRKLARWLFDNKQIIKDIRPTLPNGVINRLANKWEPLFSIAQAAGGGWMEHARQALFAQKDLSKPSKQLKLLGDIRGVIDSTGHILTHILIERLCSMDDSIYLEYNYSAFDRDKKKISPRQIANLLENYRLKPIQIKTKLGNGKGYRRDKLEAAFSRYLQTSVLTPKKSETPKLFNDSKGLSDIESETIENVFSDKNPLKPKPSNESFGVSDNIPLTPGVGIKSGTKSYSEDV